MALDLIMKPPGVLRNLLNNKTKTTRITSTRLIKYPEDGPDLLATIILTKGTELNKASKTGYSCSGCYFREG